VLVRWLKFVTITILKSCEADLDITFIISIYKLKCSIYCCYTLVELH